LCPRGWGAQGSQKRVKMSIKAAREGANRGARGELPKTRPGNDRDETDKTLPMKTKIKTGFFT